MTVPSFIGIDWGSTSFRAYLMDPRGAILDHRSAPLGVLELRRQQPDGAEPDFETVLEEQVGEWLEHAPAMPIIAAGMIGSRQGWAEVPYLACPAGPAELAANMLVKRTRRGRLVRIVPGLQVRGPGDIPDVLRGEETQALSAGTVGEGRRLCLLPGTHSKWIVIESHQIVSFATFMTGELFNILRQHSILGRLAEGQSHDRPAFDRGVKLGLAGEVELGGLLKRLFSARTLVLAGDMPGTAVTSYLSGLLLGAELREATGCVSAKHFADGVLLLGDAALVGLYARALELAGLQSRVAAPDAAARGLARIAALAGLV